MVDLLDKQLVAAVDAGEIGPVTKRVDHAQICECVSQLETGLVPEPGQCQAQIRGRQLVPEASQLTRVQPLGKGFKVALVRQ